MLGIRCRTVAGLVEATNDISVYLRLPWDINLRITIGKKSCEKTTGCTRESLDKGCCLKKQNCPDSRATHNQKMSSLEIAVSYSLSPLGRR